MQDGPKRWIGILSGKCAMSWAFAALVIGTALLTAFITRADSTPIHLDEWFHVYIVEGLIAGEGFPNDLSMLEAGFHAILLIPRLAGFDLVLGFELLAALNAALISFGLYRFLRSFDLPRAAAAFPAIAILLPPVSFGVFHPVFFVPATTATGIGLFALAALKSERIVLHKAGIAGLAFNLFVHPLVAAVFAAYALIPVAFKRLGSWRPSKRMIIIGTVVLTALAIVLGPHLIFSLSWADVTYEPINIFAAYPIATGLGLLGLLVSRGDPRTLPLIVVLAFLFANYLLAALTGWTVLLHYPRIVLLLGVFFACMAGFALAALMDRSERASSIMPVALVLLALLTLTHTDTIGPRYMDSEQFSLLEAYSLPEAYVITPPRIGLPASIATGARIHADQYFIGNDHIREDYELFFSQPDCGMRMEILEKHDISYGIIPKNVTCPSHETIGNAGSYRVVSFAR